MHGGRFLASRDGRSYFRCTIANAWHEYVAYGWGWTPDVFSAPEWTPCRVMGRMRHWSGRMVVVLDALEEARASDEIIACLVPACLCPTPRVSARFATLLQALESAPLLDFVTSIFEDIATARAFASLPASREHHHSHDGGLMEHSVECAEMVMRAYPEAGLEREIGIVSALLHDLGKLCPQRGKVSGFTIIRHDYLTLEVLAPHLARLDERYPDAAIALRYTLTWRHADGRPLIPIAELVRSVDRVSAALDARRLAFQGEPEWKQFGRLDCSGPRNRFWAPRAMHYLTSSTGSSGRT